MTSENNPTSIEFTSENKAEPTLEEQLAEMQSESDGSSDDQSSIPEKFRNAADPMAEMTKAYNELERKMSALNGDEEPQMKLEDPEGGLPDLGMDEIRKLSEEFAEKGDLDESSYEALAKRGISKEVVDMFVQSQVQTAEASRNQTLAEAGVDNGTWQTMVDWASRNWSEDQRTEWNELAASPNPLARKLAVENLKTSFSATGRGPFAAKIEGNPSTGSYAAFRSKAEMLAAMRDPRYDNDEAFRSDVHRRVEYMLQANNRQ